MYYRQYWRQIAARTKGRNSDYVVVNSNAIIAVFVRNDYVLKDLFYEDTINFIEVALVIFRRNLKNKSFLDNLVTQGWNVVDGATLELAEEVEVRAEQREEENLFNEQKPVINASLFDYEQLSFFFVI
ncbi:hypothetical protein Y032_0254g298 [Ancylostoma ceylanicum]|uniref:Uncharacterized protein n=1 Tax=Ancylostoma ceylanicum TaxID=53326 RepID=A0A016SC74_9BILA|nr:hypothetical protein Y032_0254g298 [Ancylostoma ceylanicum]